jgi:hypothetical protein
MINDCYVYVDFTERLVNKWTDTLIDTVRDIERREKDYFDTKNRGISEENCRKHFWDSPENVKKQSFYFATLCGYSANLHLPYKTYLESLDQLKNENNMYSGVGTDTDESDSKAQNESFVKKESNDIDDELMSWLDNL